MFGSLRHGPMIQADHRAPASLITPYMYTQIAFAKLAVWVVFGYTTDVWTVLGVALFALCSGLGKGVCWLSAFALSPEDPSPNTGSEKGPRPVSTAPSRVPIDPDRSPLLRNAQCVKPSR